MLLRGVLPICSKWMGTPLTCSRMSSSTDVDGEFGAFHGFHVNLCVRASQGRICRCSRKRWIDKLTDPSFFLQQLKLKNRWLFLAYNSCISHLARVVSSSSDNSLNIWPISPPVKPPRALRLKLISQNTFPVFGVNARDGHHKNLCHPPPPHLEEKCSTDF